MSYYDRFVGPGGTFATMEDHDNEVVGRLRIEAAWKCKLHKYAARNPVDWWVEQHDRRVGFVELKTRTHESTRFETVFLNVRKYNALMSYAMHTYECWSRFVVAFADCTLWIDVAMCSELRPVVGGCKTLVKSPNDIEPVLNVPVKWMAKL